LRNKVFILLIILFFGISIALFLTKHGQRPPTPREKLLAPDIELIDIRENTLTLYELKGSVIVINFWASWCQPCIEEMPLIEWLFRDLSGNPKFKLITIIYRDDEDRAFRYMKEKGYSFPVYLDPNGSAAKRFGVTGVPETYIIDKGGNLRKSIIGPLAMEYPHLVEIFHDLLNE